MPICTGQNNSQGKKKKHNYPLQINTKTCLQLDLNPFFLIQILPSLYRRTPLPAFGDQKAERKRRREGGKKKGRKSKEEKKEKLFHFNDSIATGEKKVMGNQIRYVDVIKFPDILESPHCNYLLVYLFSF